MPTGIYTRTEQHREINSKAHRGQRPTEEHKRKISGFMKGNLYSLGRIHSEETKVKMCESHKGEKAYNWKGDDVGYCALHAWVRNELGQPDTCEECGRTGLIGRQINWANKSGEYKRDLKDWRRLCISCHRNFDLKRKEP